ncbi:MAG: thiopurine S-methyltransferase, partial [Gammaproteobacteria bacterium]|nr:thiopurine S-methyltransferase [Gammaproteobacteria bacterium]
DFFALDTDTTGRLDGCYDRAALVALPAHLRPAYSEHLAGLLPAQSRSLLVTMEYVQAGMDGPPFSVPPAEVHALFTPGFSVEQIHAEDVLDTYPTFRERGLDTLTEHVFRLTGK